MSSPSVSFPSFRAPWLRGKPWHWLLFLVVGGLVLIPSALLVLGSFSTARLPTDFSLDRLALTNYLVV